MANSAWTGPLLTFGQVPGSNDYNPDNQGPSLFAWGVGMADTRLPFIYQPGKSATSPYYGYLGGTLTLIDQAPAQLTDAAIAASQAMTASTPLTLVTSSGAGITVGTSITRADTGATVTGLLAIDVAQDPVEPTAQGSGLTLWNPAQSISRAVSLTSSDNLSAVNFTIAGYDLYGYPMTVTRAGPNNGTVNTTKAFKYITSVTPSASNAGAVTVGLADIFGIPLRADKFGYLTIFWNDTLITASTGFVAAVTTSPATVSTGDVRGTYATQTASDGTKALQMFWRPKVANLSQTGIWGVTQV